MTPTSLCYYCSLLYFLVLIKAGCGTLVEDCNLVRLLLQAREDEADIPHWLCLARVLSGMNKTKVSQEFDKPSSYGLFQIKGREWCGEISTGGLCEEICSRLATDDLRPQIQCAQQVRDTHCYWGAWPVWKERCQDRDLPDIHHCFKN